MSDLYDQDFIGWTEYQARVLRDAAKAGSNLGLDWANLVEEVEGLGKSHYYAVASRIARVIEHLLKLEFSPASAPRDGWLETLQNARDAIGRRLEDDPGLRPRLAEMVRREAPRATKRAAESLARYGEHAAAAQARASGGVHYTTEQILGDWLPEKLGQP